jgi:hypothetical protein
MIRLLPALAVLLLAIAATWHIARRTAEPPPAAPTAAPPVPTQTPTAAPSPAVAAATPGPAYRLAGTVVGDVQFAVIEAPDGSNELYALGDDVPGLGKLVAIGPRSATFENSEGRFDMPLIAAPTPTRRAGAAAANDEEDTDGGLDELPDDEPYFDEPYDDEGDEEYLDGGEETERLDGEGAGF